MKNHFKKFIACFIVSAIFVFSLSGCGIKRNVDEFNDFAMDCYATDYYNWCNDLNVDCEKKYHYNLDSSLIFVTYTMVLKCNYTPEDFETICNKLDKETKIRTVVNECKFKDKVFDVYYVENDNRTYSEFQEFGFILVNKDLQQIDYCWFFDPDNDIGVFSEQSFCNFYELYYDWLV